MNIKLNVELTSSAFSLFGFAPQPTTVLNTTADTVEVVGKPLSIGHFVNETSIGTPIFSSITKTYSPYLIVAGEALDSTQDGVIRGQDYQEVLTNFPLGSQVLTEVFLEIDVIAPDGTTRSYQRTLGDRIGLAARRNGGSTPLVLDPQAPMLISPLDITTISILPGKYDRGALDAAGTELEALGSRVTEFSARAAASAGASDPERNALADEAMKVLRTTLVATARGKLALFQAVSDEYAELFARDMRVKAYFDSPRITLFRTRADVGTDNSLLLNLSLDLRKNDLRALPHPDQNVVAGADFQLVRGFLDTSIETAVVGESEQVVGLQFTIKVSAQTIFTAAEAQGIGITILTSNSSSELDALDIPTDAKVLIGDALAGGKTVIVPIRSVLIDGQPRLGWYESDPITGETIGVLDDGTHGIIETIADTLARFLPVGVVQFGLGVLTGFGIGGAAALFKGLLIGAALKAGLPRSVTEDPRFRKGALLLPILAAFKEIASEAKSLLVRFPAFAAGFFVGLSIAAARLAADPPLGNILLSPPLPGTFGNLTGSGVAASIIPDPEFTLPFGGTQLPTIFRVGIKNLGSSADTFTLNFTNIPAGFTAQTSIPQITIPPGETAEVGICLRPVSGISAPGTSASLSLNVISTTNPAITTSDTEPFVLPEVHGVTLVNSPPALSTTPGTPVSASVMADPVLVPPGTSTVKTTIAVTSNIATTKVEGDLTRLLSGVTPNASSFFDGRFRPLRAIDGSLNTSWFTANGDAANLGKIPFFEVIFPVDVTVTELQMFGNRESANGFDFFAGIFQLFDVGGNVLFESGVVNLPAPDRDVTLPIPNVAKVRRVRFTATADEGSNPGFAELKVIGSAFPLPPIPPNPTPDCLTDPNAPTGGVLGATVQTFITLGVDPQVTCIENTLWTDPAGFKLGTFLKGAEGLGGTPDPTLLNFDFSTVDGTFAGNANRRDFFFVQDTGNAFDFGGGIIGGAPSQGLIWDLGGQANQAVVFVSVDHGPIPQETLESSVWLSNDPDAPDSGWTQAFLDHVYMQGWSPDPDIADGFVGVYRLPNNQTFRFVSVTRGGPAALNRDGDDEIDAVGGLTAGGTGLNSIAIELHHRLPASGYVIDPASISPAATTVSASEIQWTVQAPITGQPSLFQLSGQVPNMMPGETRAISLGSEVDATVTTASGMEISLTIPLPSLVVAAVHILDLDPPSQTVQAGATADYNVLVKNPLTTSETFTLSAAGLSGFTVDLASSINVGAGQTASVPLRVAVPSGAVQQTRVSVSSPKLLRVGWIRWMGS